ncbi:MAG: hypothetical protein QXU82_02995 [Candidatus Aenigmatarchaeota archaeon]
MSKAQPVYDVLDRIDAPTGKEKVFFPGSTHLPEGNRDYKSKKFVANLDHRQMTLLGQEISKRYGERYTLLPLQTSCDLAHKDKEFKKMNVDYWLHNEPVILEVGEIIAHPIVKEVDGELKYDYTPSKMIKTEINESDVFDTLMKAGLLKEPKKKVYRGGIDFEDGEASVRSNWYSDGGCFSAYAYRPSYRDDHGVAAFVKTGEAVEKPKMRVIAESEYQEFIRIKKEHEALLKELAPVKKYF